ncbi:MAG: TetR/AcrR family transcriptional regulator [Steroidobacteraceae bacterium]
MTKGGMRSREILEVARRILVEEGYKNLTLRRVAQSVGISIGNLQYYFPAKEDLERQVLQYARDRAIRECGDYFDQLSGGAEVRFERLIKFLLASVNRPDTRGLHLQGWAVATHDDHVEYCMEQLFHERCVIVARAIEQLNPEIDAAERLNRATVIHAMIVGSVFSCMTQDRSLVKRRGLDRILGMRALALAKAPIS